MTAAAPRGPLSKTGTSDGGAASGPLSRRPHFPALDGMRGLAFLGVFFHHYSRSTYGWVGVDAFFVLSGFLITGILYETRHDLHRVRNFYIRRTLRIFPLYYGVMLAIVALAPIAHWQWDWRWLIWPAYCGNLFLFFHHGHLDPGSVDVLYAWLRTGHHTVYLGHLWSLCVEEQFYLIWPWIVFRVMDRRRLIAIATAIIVVCPFFRIWATHHLGGEVVKFGITFHSTPFRMDTLMVGALIALLYRGENRMLLMRWAGPVFWLCLIGLNVTGALLIAKGHRDGFDSFLTTFGFTVIAFASGALILNCLSAATAASRICSNAVLRWIGRISYGAYVFHDIPHVWYVAVAARIHLPASSLALPATLLVAWLSFRYFESAFLKLKDRWTLSNLARSPEPQRT